MKSSLARHYLMRSLAMKRQNVKAIHDKVRSGMCIIEGCENNLRARGLCDKHRQRWYLEMRNLGSDEERLAAEEKAIQLGLILPTKEQDEVRREATNPFAKAVG